MHAGSVLCTRARASSVMCGALCVPVDAAPADFTFESRPCIVLYVQSSGVMCVWSVSSFSLARSLHRTTRHRACAHA